MILQTLKLYGMLFLNLKIRVLKYDVKISTNILYLLEIYECGI